METQARQDSYLTERRTLLPPQRVRELSSLKPGRMVRDAITCWAMILGAWLLAVMASNGWITAFAFIVVGNRYYALFIIGHDGLHRRLFGTALRNDRFCDFLLLGPIGAITRINNRNHLLHHQFLSTDEDPDRFKHTCAEKGTGLELLEYMTGASSVIRSVGHVFLDRSDPGPDATKPKSGRRSYRPRDILIIVGWQVSLLAGLTLAFGWWGYIGMWWLPVFLLTFLPDNLRTFAEHSHPESDVAADQHRLVTNIPSWIERQFLAPMNMHYHAAHHLWPSIPYYNLPAADKEMRPATGTERISWRGSYVAYLWRYYRSLPVEGCGRAAAHA